MSSSPTPDERSERARGSWLVRFGRWVLEVVLEGVTELALLALGCGLLAGLAWLAVWGFARHPASTVAVLASLVALASYAVYTFLWAEPHKEGTAGAGRRSVRLWSTAGLAVLIVAMWLGWAATWCNCHA